MKDKAVWAMSKKADRKGGLVLQYVLLGVLALFCWLLQSAPGIETTLEWNPGNHFMDAPRRTARALAWAAWGKNAQPVP